MQFTEKQERQVHYRLEEGEYLDFEPIFDIMLRDSVNQIAFILPRHFFWNEENLNDFVSDIPNIEIDMQKDFDKVISKQDQAAYKNNAIAIEGYYRKCYKDFEDVYDYDALVILYLIIRPRKNIDGIKSLIKVGEDYEL